MRYFLIAGFLLMQLTVSSQPLAFNNQATVYLVRHAEKLPGNDSLLTTEGNKRAGDLMRTLRGKNIERIYVTGYKRTQHTGDSLRLQWGIDTVHYLADTSCADLFYKIRANNDMNKAILIIGHSNTVPIIIRKLGISDYPLEYIPDSEFDNLFVVRFKRSKPSVTKLKYGTTSGESATMK